MMTIASFRKVHIIGVALALLLVATVGFRPARADVTVQELTTMSLAGMNMDITTIERTTSDRQRRDTETRCHGLLALACRDVLGGDIVRLDKQLEWQLEPKKKLYTENLFPTAEQRALAQQQLQAMMDQMKNCPMPQSAGPTPSGPDTSHCQLTAPVANVTQTGEHANVVGHDTQKTSIVLSQTCTDPQSGDVCEIDYGFDSWLTQDDLPGAAERRDFALKHLAALGLDPHNPQLAGMAQRLMAPYADTLKQLSTKESALKGYPLRTTFYVAFGGPHCSKAQQAQPAQQSSSSGGHGGGLLRGLAADAVSGTLGGLFHRRGNAAETQPPPADTQSAASQTVRFVSFTTETKSIDTAAIAPDLFDIPAGWTLQPQQVAKTNDKFVCPTSRG